MKPFFLLVNHLSLEEFYIKSGEFQRIFLSGDGAKTSFRSFHEACRSCDVGDGSDFVMFLHRLSLFQAIFIRIKLEGKNADLQQILRDGPAVDSLSYVAAPLTVLRNFAKPRRIHPSIFSFPAGIVALVRLYLPFLDV